VSMVVTGGLRARLIHDSIYFGIRDGLQQLGWFDPSPPRQHYPINYTYEPVENDTEVPPNTVALSDENLSEVEAELGSSMVETSWTYYLDFYAENDVLGKHLINDVRDILGGRMPSIGRNDASMPVWDYSQATPVQIFSVDIESIVVDRAHDFPKSWQRFWYSCSFIVRDAY